MKNILSLLLAFLQVGLFSFGGGYATIPLIREQVVEGAAWLTPREFSDIITISQMTPGPLAVNTSTFVGMRIGGLAGAVAATAGCVISGFVVALLLYRFFGKRWESPLVNGALEGLKAASVGLIAAAAASMLVLAFSPVAANALNWTAAIIFALSLFCLRKKKLNPILLMVLTAVAGILAY